MCNTILWVLTRMIKDKTYVVSGSDSFSFQPILMQKIVALLKHAISNGLTLMVHVETNNTRASQICMHFGNFHSANN